MSMLRKDIENKRCAVYYARIQQLLQVSLLRRREFIVKNHQVEPQLFLQIAEFLCAPLAEVCRDIGMAQSLYHLSHNLCTCSICQRTQFTQCYFSAPQPFLFP